MSPGRSGRLGHLDGIRGGAVVLVVIYHANWLTADWGPRLLPGGFVGVDLFFVLSGFLITRLLLAEAGRSGRVDLVSFTRRRFRRLSPALAAMTVTTLVAMAVAGHLPTTRHAVVSALSTIFYVSNFQQAAGHYDLLELSHTWSLAIEGQFYVVWPLVVVAAMAVGLHRFRLGRMGWVAGLVGAVGVLAVRRSHLWTTQDEFLRLYVGTDTRLDGLLIGCILGLASVWGWLTPRLGRALRLPAVLGVGVLLAAALLSETGDERMYRQYGLVVVALAAAAIVASAVIEPRWGPNRFWSVAPLRWLGRRSYSLYLWHVPVFFAVARNLPAAAVGTKVIIGVGAALVLSELSYRLIETRFRAPSTLTAG